MLLTGRLHGDGGLCRVHLSAALSDLRTAFFSSGAARSASENCKREEGRVPGRLTLPEGVAPLAPRLFRLAAFHMARRLVRRPVQHTGGLISEE